MQSYTSQDLSKRLPQPVSQMADSLKPWIGAGAHRWYDEAREAISEADASPCAPKVIAALSQRSLVGHDIARALWGLHYNKPFSQAPALTLPAHYGTLRPALPSALAAAEAARSTGAHPQGPKIGTFSRWLSGEVGEMAGIVDGVEVRHAVIDTHMCALLFPRFVEGRWVGRTVPGAGANRIALSWACQVIGDSLGIGQAGAQAALWVQIWGARNGLGSGSKADVREAVRRSSYAVAVRTLKHWWVKP